MTGIAMIGVDTTMTVPSGIGMTEKKIAIVICMVEIVVIGKSAENQRRGADIVPQGLVVATVEALPGELAANLAAGEIMIEVIRLVRPAVIADGEA